MSESTTSTAVSNQTVANNPAQKGSPGTNPLQRGNASEGKKPNGEGGGLPLKSATGDVGEPKRYKFEKVKIRGKEIDIDADESQMKRYIQMGYEANERHAEAKRMREEADRIYQENHQRKQQEEKEWEEIQRNPVIGVQKAIKNLVAKGLSPQQARAAIEEHLYGEIQKDEMSPDAKRALALEEENRKLKEQWEAERKAKEEENLNQSAAEYRKQIVPQMMSAMDAVGLAKTAANLSSVARRLKIAADQKRPISVDQAVQLTHQDNQAVVQSTIGGQVQALNHAYKSNNMDAVMQIGKELEGFLGDEAIAAIQRYGILKWRNKVPKMPHQAIDTAKSTRAPQEPVEMTRDEILEERKKRALEIDARRARGAVTGP